MQQASAYDFSTTVPSIDYLVLANSTLSRSVMPLVLYRRSQGLNVEIVNPEEIIRNYAGKNASDRIRNFIHSRYEAWNLKFLLIVGSERSVPYKDLYPSLQRKESLTEVGKTWSDIFYADLSSEYDSDRNGFSGEYLKDRGIDFKPEIYVGRIPFDNANDVSKVISNILEFERSIKSRTALLAASILNFSNEEMLDGRTARSKTDGATLTDAIYRDLLVSSGYRTHRIYEKSGLSPSLYPAEYSLRKLNFENLLINNSYDLIVWNGHGTDEALETKIWQSDPNRNNRPDKHELVVNQVLNLSSMQLPLKGKGIFITGSCSSISPGKENLGASALKAGFTAFIGGTSINWFSEGWRNINDGGNQTLLYMVTRNLILRNQSIGEALYHAIQQTATEYMTFGAKDYQNFYSFNLYGDPALGLIGNSFQDISVTVDNHYKTINLGDSLDFTFNIKSDAGQNMNIKAIPINYRSDLFTVFFYPDTVQSSGIIKMRIVMARNLFPSNYSICIHFVSSGKNVFKVLNFLILPWENDTQIYINQPNSHVRRNTDFSIDVEIRKANNVDSIYVELAYNDTLLSFNPRNFILGPFLSSDGVLPKYDVAMVGAGIIGISCTRTKFQRGISGEGLIFSLPFRSLRDGTTNLTFQRFLLFDPSGLQIPIKAHNGRVQVSSNGLYIDRNLIQGQLITRPQANLSGSTNADRISISCHDISQLIELDDKGRFQTDVSLTSYETSLNLFAQKGTDQFIRLRTNIFSSSFISIQLRIGDSNSFINGKPVPLDAPPLIIQSRTMVPIRFIGESFGAKVDWLPQDQSIIISTKDIRLTLWIGRTQAILEKRGVRQNLNLDVPPRIIQNRTFVPLRFIAEGFEARVSWNELYQLISIEYIR